MRLFKNVDIKDLDSILEHGILSANASGNHNWESRRRAPNSSDVVYLFRPKTARNSFPHYGLALLEVEVEGAREMEFCEGDTQAEDYAEFVVDRVAPEQILSIKVPRIAKRQACRYYDEWTDTMKEVSPETLDRIEWVDIAFQLYKNDGLEDATKVDQSQVEKTLMAVNTTEMNFFRAKNKKNEVMALCNVIYKEAFLYQKKKGGASR